MRALSFLIKPASGLCNMRCSYCFYADEMEKRETPLHGIMTHETAAALIDRAFSADATQCTFAFQGGEPTLAGLSYFRDFVEQVRRRNTAGVAVSYAIQTNGYAMDEEWALFLAQNDFLVGLSVDGYADLHDLYRHDAAQSGTHSRVMRAAKLLEKYKVPFNILTVVTAQTARHVEKVYAFYKKAGFSFQQYIPCLDPLGEPRGQEQYSLTPVLYGEFLTKLFRLWAQDLRLGKQPYIRYFENLVMMLAGQLPEACGMLGHCTHQLVVEGDGRVYPCDFYVLDGYCIGSVHTDTLEEMDRRRQDIGFIEASTAVAQACKSCKWQPLCRGGCRRDRDDHGVIGLNYYCDAYRAFFEQAYPVLEAVARQVRAHRP